MALLGSRKRRREALDALNHFGHWDSRFSQAVDSSEDLVKLLRTAGAKAECRVISDCSELDGQYLPLEEAIFACERCGFASVVCCVPGVLAFYFDESASPRRRLLLRRES